MPCGLYERRARERVAGLGYPAAPLECSDGVSPHQLAKAGAERNLLKDPASAASLKAVRVSTPLMQDSASTVARQRSVPASATTLLSSCRLSDSAQRA